MRFVEMAKRKKSRGEKSAAIRDYRSKNPNAKPKEIAENLNKTGMNITPQYVSTILSNDRRGRRPVGRPRKVAAEGAFDHLLAVKKLVTEVGSVKAAQDAISQYSKLMA
jgi:hypothetical protein